MFVALGWFLDIQGLTVFTWYWLAGLIVATVVGMLAIRRQFGWLKAYKVTWDKKLIKKWFGYAAWVVIGTNATILLTQVDQQFALYFFGAESAGYRTNYLTLFNSVTIICTPLI